LLKTWRFPKLPTPGDVRRQIEEAREKGVALEAAAEWESAVSFASQWYHPDLGIVPGAPTLSPVTWLALKAAGGLYHLSQCPTGDLQWARKRFDEHFTLGHETQKVEHLLPEGEAKKSLAQLCAPALKQLSPPGEEELRQRWEEQKRRLAERAAERTA
jgi:hypothetical protein